MLVNSVLYSDFVDNCNAIDREPLSVLSAMAFYFHTLDVFEIPDFSKKSFLIDSHVDFVAPSIVVNIAKLDDLPLDAFVTHLFLWFNEISISIDFDFRLRRLLNLAPFKN